MPTPAGVKVKACFHSVACCACIAKYVFILWDLIAFRGKSFSTFDIETSISSFDRLLIQEAQKIESRSWDIPSAALPHFQGKVGQEGLERYVRVSFDELAALCRVRIYELTHEPRFCPRIWQLLFLIHIFPRLSVYGYCRCWGFGLHSETRYKKRSASYRHLE